MNQYPRTTLLLLAITLRLIFFLLTIDHPEKYVQVDSNEYLRLANNLRVNHTFSTSENAPFIPDLRRTPVYSVFLGIFPGLNIDNFIFAIIAQILISIIQPIVMFNSFRLIVKERTAFWACILFIFCISSMVYPFLLLTETLFFISTNSYYSILSICLLQSKILLVYRFDAGIAQDKLPALQIISCAPGNNDKCKSQPQLQYPFENYFSISTCSGI